MEEIKIMQDHIKSEAAKQRVQLAKITATAAAIIAGNKKEVELFLPKTKGALEVPFDSEGTTVLHLAVSCCKPLTSEEADTLDDTELRLRKELFDFGRQLSILKYVLKAPVGGANVNAVDHNGMTPIHLAADVGSEEALKILLETPGSQPHTFDKEARTPLLFACYRGKVGVVRALLETGRYRDEWVPKNSQRDRAFAVEDSDASSINNTDADLSETARSKEEPDIDEFIEEEEMKISAKAKAKPFRKIKFEVRNRFQNKFTKIDACDKLGNSPLHHAIIHRNGIGDALEVVKLLLDNGANPNALNNENQTPLYWAVNRAPAGSSTSARISLDIVWMLLTAGADPTIRDKLGKSPLYLACYNNNNEMINVLLNNGANIEEVSLDGLTPLWWCIFRNNSLGVQALLRVGADVNFKDPQERTPLMLARELGPAHKLIARLLRAGGGLTSGQGPVTNSIHERVKRRKEEQEKMEAHRLQKEEALRKSKEKMDEALQEKLVLERRVSEVLEKIEEMAADETPVETSPNLSRRKPRLFSKGSRRQLQTASNNDLHKAAIRPSTATSASQSQWWTHGSSRPTTADTISR